MNKIKSDIEIARAANIKPIKERNSHDQLAWWVYNYLTQRSRKNIVESSSTLYSDSAPGDNEHPTSSWLSCSPCLDCFALEPNERKRKHIAQAKPQERKRARPSSPL